MTSSRPSLFRSTLVAVLLAGAALATPALADPAHPMRTAKPSDDVLRRELTPMQYEVTQHAATEAPFTPGYFDNHAAGLYVDITTGQPLFSSNDKFDSGTGWPSFFRTIAPGVITERRDATHGTVRTEVRSTVGDAHLGHVFTDGPKPTGLRYCINSAALRFIPVDRLAAEGYGAYRPLFITAAR